MTASPTAGALEAASAIVQHAVMGDLLCASHIIRSSLHAFRRCACLFPCVCTAAGVPVCALMETDD